MKNISTIESKSVGKKASWFIWPRAINYCEIIERNQHPAGGIRQRQPGNDVTNVVELLRKQQYSEFPDMVQRLAGVSFSPSRWTQKAFNFILLLRAAPPNKLNQ